MRKAALSAIVIFLMLMPLSARKAASNPHWAALAGFNTLQEAPSPKKAHVPKL